MVELSIKSINIRGLRNNYKRKSVFDDLASTQCDIIFLQETHCTNELEASWQREWKNKVIFCNGTAQSAGVALLFKSSLCYKNYLSDNEGRLQIIDIELRSKTICLVNIYAPNKDKDRASFFEKLFHLLQNRYYDEIILGGDFNLVLSATDKLGGTKFKRQKSLQKLENMIEQLCLTDIWKKKHPTIKSYTWAQKNPKIMCRLDYFLVTKGLEKTTRQCDILFSAHTDHKMISLQIQGHLEERGPGFWKLNNSFLLDGKYCESIQKLIDQKWNEYQHITDLNLRYELLKFEIKQYSYHYGKERAKQARQNEKDLISRIEALDRKIILNTATTEEQDLFYSLKGQLNEMKIYKAKGQYIRSRIEFVENNERSTRYFFNQEKQAYDKKTISKLTTEDGTETTDSKEILATIRNFYQNLYSSKQTNPGYDLLRELDVEKLSENDQQMCEGGFTIEECYKALSNMNRNKSPGSDGLTVEFYLRFWEQMGPKLLQVFQSSSHSGILPQSLRQAVITVLHKQGKSPAEIKNYRPISLLNTDYKILSKSIANRISPLLSQLISPDQTGFIKNRYIGENIRLISDIIEITEKSNTPGLLLLLDFEKAYDTVEWHFMSEVLNAFNFGPSISKWIKLCYTNISSTVLNNGFSCGWFEIKRGFRQGCGLSCVLFILVAEILAKLIRKSKEVKGISVMGKEYKLSQYADDTTCILADPNSALVIIAIAKTFENVSGLRLNIDKTQLIWLGPWKTKTEDIGCITAHSGNFNLLGINLGYLEHAKTTANFEDKLYKLSKRQNMWSGRDLSLIGKILIAKSLGLSNLVYSMSNVTFPSHLIKLTQQKVNNFIWNNKPAKVKHSTLILEYADGGLRAPDVEIMNKSLKLAWLSRMYSNAAWFQLADDAFFGPYGGFKYLSNCNYGTKYLKDLPRFYFEILSYLKEITNKSSSQIQTIWNNENVIVNRKMLFKRSWKQAGVEYFKDLKTESKRWLTLDEFELKFNVRSNLVEYNAVIRAISEKNYVQYEVTNDTDLDRVYCKTGKVLDKTKSRCKDYYREFIAMQKDKPTSLYYWNKYGFEEKTVLSSILHIRKCTKDTKLIAFQFKIQNNFVACSKNLTNWGILNNKLCPKCAQEDDTSHSLVECPYSLQKISEVYELVKIPCINFNPSGFLFGTGCKVLDLINLVTKYLIWKSRFYETDLSPMYVKNELIFRQQADKVSQKRNTFESKWQELTYLQLE